jgi:hypothetical protein
MNNLHSHFRDVTERLRPLRNVFSDGPEGSKYRNFFDEYLSVNELELALHAACDFLLEATTPAASEATMAQIGELHRLMKLEDDCSKRLKGKSQSTTQR